MTSKEVLHGADDKMKKSIEALSRNFAEVRTGRASPHLVEGLHIDYYGTPTLLKQIGQITVPDPHMIVIQPWDPTAIVEIEKAIQKSNLGISPSNDGKVVRLSIPPLSKDRRQEMVKQIHQMAEDGKVSLRTIRHAAKEAIEKLEKDKIISEDEKFRSLDDLEKKVTVYISKVEEILKLKDKELTDF